MNQTDVAVADSLRRPWRALRRPSTRGASPPRLPRRRHARCVRGCPMNPRCFLAGLAMTLSVGCATPTLRFTVTHAALINLAPGGNTVAVGENPAQRPPGGRGPGLRRPAEPHRPQPQPQHPPRGVGRGRGDLRDRRGQHLRAPHRDRERDVQHQRRRRRDQLRLLVYPQEVGTGTVQVLFRVVEDTSAHRVVFEADLRPGRDR